MPLCLPIRRQLLTRLTTGHLLSWGAYSAGALGLGHPQLANTPLSSPAANAAPPSSAAAQEQSGRSSARAPYPMSQFGDAPLQHPLFPGFLPARPATPVQRPPDRVEKPTRVRFHGELAGGGSETGRSTFVYAVAASGWHSGCLSVSSSTSTSASSSSTEASPLKDEPIIRLPRRTEAAEQEMADLARAADEEALNGSRGWMGRLGTLGPFRAGFAGRGAARGGGLTRDTGRGGQM